MTAVESCPACNRAQRRATRRCDWCGIEFDHVIEPPPGIRWRLVVFTLLIAALFLLLEIAMASQFVVKRVSIEELSARAPVIVLAQRASDEPLVVEKTAPVKLSDGSTKIVTTQFRFWCFTVIDGVRNQYRGVLSRDIFVVRASAGADDEIYRESLAGYSITYGRERYENEARRLDDLGDEPVVLFLRMAHNTETGPDTPDNAYSLFIGGSIEHAEKFDEIEARSKLPYEDPTRPTITEDD